jgi:hypothetical protein
MVRLLALAAGLALAPGAAWSAQLVDVRVGRHDEFTRIVFELDAPAGYRIEREESAGGSELVVTLEAGGSSRRVPTPKSLVEGVSIDSLGPENAVAHIRLASDALRLKEMILSGPPRIVLDVLPAETAKAPAPARRATPRAEAKPKPAPAPKSTAPARERPKRAAAAPPRKPATAPDVPASAAPATPQPQKPPSGEAIVPREAKPPPRAEPRPQATPQKQAAAPEGGAGSSLPEELAMATPQERAAPPPRPPRASEPPRAARSPEERATRPAPPPARRAPPEKGGGLFDARTLGLAAGGIFLLALGFLWIRRRRAESFEEGEEGFSLEDGGLAQGETNPFDESAPQSAAGEVPSAPPPAAAQESTPARAEGGSMETPSATTDSLFSPTPSGAAAAAGPAGGAEHEDIMRLVRELERRVANLETRLDEAIDAKERLERQVAAQTEELRVQRAAIARTQRAVRNLSRPEEEHATEPALRDGEGPS